MKLGMLTLFCLLMMFCVGVHRIYAASNQYLGKDCKAEANWALVLLKDRNAGIPLLNVMPADEETLKIVLEHQGTQEELWWKVYGACSGQTT